LTSIIELEPIEESLGREKWELGIRENAHIFGEKVSFIDIYI